ncbi:C-C motif chemokine 20a.3 [Genypterus blacodes]|uniref:C-C motif chemokine 20a.3 n=1 Tax=Genypterus blacodes TaxID=154954 RepID=UPI003F76CC05
MVLIKAPVMVLVLLAIVLLATKSSAARHGCCHRYSMGRIPFTIIKGYSVQTITENCGMDAIIFHTTKGKACTNPTLDWVMFYVNRLRNKAQNIHLRTSKTN